MTETRPIIGITLDWQEKGTFSERPHYALREHYFDAITRAGGLPIGIPHAPDQAETYINMCNGLLVPGGEFELPESWYEDIHQAKPYLPSPRLANDIAMMEVALKQKKPVLGICAGMQILGGIHGCRMTRNLQAYEKTAINHYNATPVDQYAHDVKVIDGTLLFELTRRKVFEVNSHHCEAFVSLSDHVITSAYLPGDSTIEAIEVLKYPFALGIQWHPEFFLEEGNPNFAIFKGFVNAAAGKYGR